MKTTLDLPRPLIHRLATHAAREHIPISRYITKALEKSLPKPPAPPPPPDPLFQSLREELGL